MAVRTRLIALVSTVAAWALACAAASATVPQPAPAADADTVDVSESNLIAVLRESTGENKQDDTLVPYGRVTAQMPDGRRVDLATSWYRYLGDTHIRLVFDGGKTLQSATPNDLERLRLTPEEALDVAVRNMRRLYGTPQARPWSGDLMQVQGGMPDLASSYFLDREFWLGVLREHPEGIVVAVPQRTGLVYGSAADQEAVEELRFGAAALYAGSRGTRVSSALYLFKNGRWSVFQPPLEPQ
jgi:uncharacterized protein YtpQ (UPF0354 family)